MPLGGGHGLGERRHGSVTLSSLSLVTNLAERQLDQENIACKSQLHILRKASHKRTHADLRRLADSFEGIQFFQNLDQAVKIQVCQSLKLEHFPSGHIVFRENEPGDQFYIILHGTVSVCIKDVTAEDVERRETEEQERRPTLKKILCFAEDELPKAGETSRSAESCGEHPAGKVSSAEQQDSRTRAETYGSNYSTHSSADSRQGSKNSTIQVSEAKKSNVRVATAACPDEKQNHAPREGLDSSGSAPTSKPNSRQGSRNTRGVRLVDESLTNSNDDDSRGSPAEDGSNRGKSLSTYGVVATSEQTKSCLRRNNTTGLEASQPASLRDMMKLSSFSEHIVDEARHSSDLTLKKDSDKIVGNYEKDLRRSLHESTFEEFGTQDWLQVAGKIQHKEPRRTSLKSAKTQGPVQSARRSSGSSQKSTKSATSETGEGARRNSSSSQKSTKSATSGTENGTRRKSISSPKSPKSATSGTEDGARRNSSSSQKSATVLSAAELGARRTSGRNTSDDDERRKSITDLRRLSLRYTSMQTGAVSESAKEALVNAQGCLHDMKVQSDRMDTLDWLQSKEVEQESLTRRHSMQASASMRNRRKSATKPIFRKSLPPRRGSHYFKLSDDLGDKDHSSGDGSFSHSSEASNESHGFAVRPVESPPTSSDENDGEGQKPERLSRPRGTACGRLLKHSIAKLAQEGADDDDDDDEHSSCSSDSHQSKKSGASKKSSNAAQSNESSEESSSDSDSDSDSEGYSSLSSFTKTGNSTRKSMASIGSKGSRRKSMMSRQSTISVRSTKSVTITEPEKRRSNLGASMSALKKVQRVSRKISEIARLLPRLQQVATLRAGAAFGEVALQNDQPRSATIECKEECYFAVLTRDDYKDILKTTLEKHRQELMDFLTQLPLFAGVNETSVHKISVMLTHRVMRRGELVFDIGDPVLQVYFARDGMFAVSAPPCRAHVEEEDQGVAKPRSVVKKEIDYYLGLKKNKHVTLSLLEAPIMFGLSCYIRGDRKHQIRVTCKSVTGNVYAVLAKELIHHLSRSCRERLQKSALLERLFYDNRMLVLEKVAAPMETSSGAHGAAHGQRRCRDDDNVMQKLQAFRGDHDAHMDLYSLQGRLRAIAKVFQQPTATRAEVTKNQGGSAGATKDEHCSSGMTKDERSHSRKRKVNLADCWWLQTVMSNHPEAVGDKLHSLIRKLDKDFNGAESLMYQKSLLALVGVKQEEAHFAHASHDDARLALAFDRHLFHGDQPDRQPGGRADGSTPAVRPTSVNVNVLGRNASQTPASRRTVGTSSRSPGPSRHSPDVRVTSASRCEHDLLETTRSSSPRDASVKAKTKSVARAVSTDQQVIVGVDIIQRRRSDEESLTSPRCSTAPASNSSHWVFSDPSVVPEKALTPHKNEERQGFGLLGQLMPHDTAHANVATTSCNTQDANGQSTSRLPELSTCPQPTTPRTRACDKASPVNVAKVSPTMPSLAGASTVSPEESPAGFISSCTSLSGTRNLEDVFNRQCHESELHESLLEQFFSDKVMSASFKESLSGGSSWISQYDGINPTERHEKARFSEVDVACIYKNRLKKTRPVLPSCFGPPPLLIPPKGRNRLPPAACQKIVAMQI